jgi:hypothetical protein
MNGTHISVVLEDAVLLKLFGKQVCSVANPLNITGYASGLRLHSPNDSSTQHLQVQEV